MNDPISQRLAEFLAKEILRQPKRQISTDDALISSGLVDSMSLVDVAIFAEKQFGVRIDDTELNADTFDTLGELTELIHQRGNLK